MTELRVGGWLPVKGGGDVSWWLTPNVFTLGSFQATPWTVANCWIIPQIYDAPQFFNGKKCEKCVSYIQSNTVILFAKEKVA
jgi:hypothetical protein